MCDFISFFVSILYFLQATIGVLHISIYCVADSIHQYTIPATTTSSSNLIFCASDVWHHLFVCSFISFEMRDAKGIANQAKKESTIRKSRILVRSRINFFFHFAVSSSDWLVESFLFWRRKICKLKSTEAKILAENEREISTAVTYTIDCTHGRLQVKGKCTHKIWQIKNAEREV